MRTDGQDPLPVGSYRVTCSPPVSYGAQVAALRRQARWYRRRAWGVNFCREHLNQLQSQNNFLWEPAETVSPDPSRQDAAEEPRPAL